MAYQYLPLPYGAIVDFDGFKGCNVWTLLRTAQQNKNIVSTYFMLPLLRTFCYEMAVLQGVGAVLHHRSPSRTPLAAQRHDRLVPWWLFLG